MIDSRCHDIFTELRFIRSTVASFIVPGCIGFAMFPYLHCFLRSPPCVLNLGASRSHNLRTIWEKNSPRLFGLMWAPRAGYPWGAQLGDVSTQPPFFWVKWMDQYPDDDGGFQPHKRKIWAQERYPSEYWSVGNSPTNRYTDHLSSRLFTSGCLQQWIPSLTPARVESQPQKGLLSCWRTWENRKSVSGHCGWNRSW